ncbi:MAG: hypothetical protein NC433_04565 [Clostridiales bacterium]|nr:hypothetical protein [Clostridiales bacterium]
MRGLLLINWRGGVIFQLIDELKKKPNPTPAEKNAIKAFNRIIIGTLILCFIMVIALIITMSVPLFTGSISARGDRRYGTVQDDGRIHYTQGTHQYATQEELGLEQYQLTQGDKVVLFFDSVTEELISAYPENISTASENKWAISLLSVLVISIIILIFYAMFICRATSWGSPLYQWLNTQPRWLEVKNGNKDWQQMPLWLKLVVAVLVLILASIILAPQLMEIIEKNSSVF